MRSLCGCVLVFWLSSLTALAAEGIEEIKVKRQEVFAFTQKPAVTRNGNTFTITFASKGFCDVAVAIEGGDGQILRHLAGGVLGPNAPAPFQKDSLRQSLVWDGKDDRGRYVEDTSDLSVRVSLGLSPRFERTLFWSPYKRYGAVTPMIQPTPEGVYVFDTRGKNTLRLYDHDGQYIRTVHPAPADKVGQMKGVEFITPPQADGGRKVPVLRGFCQTRFLTASETVFNDDTTHHGDPVYSATGMAIHNGRVALAYLKLNRLATDGTTGGLPLEGPEVGYRDVRAGHFFDRVITLGPSSMAFAPDGKTLYLTGFMSAWSGGRSNWGPTEVSMHGVRRMDYTADAEPTLFAGKMALQGEGSDDEHFAGPSSVACDSAGRVYVSDYLNDRIQVFSPDGKLLKSLAASKPAKVVIDPRNDQIIAMSWPLLIFSGRILAKYDLLVGENGNKLRNVPPTWTRLGTFDMPADKPQPMPLPLDTSTTPTYFYVGQPWEVAFDFWADEPTVWIVDRKRIVDEAMVRHHGKFAWQDGWDQWGSGGIRIFGYRDGEWVKKRDFNELVIKSIHRLRPPTFHNQRITVNPVDRKLYLLEFRGHLGMKSNDEILRIDPETGRVVPIRLPISSEALCFDMEGHAYLRDSQVVMRYDPQNWHEIPWDYGEERDKVGMAPPTVKAVGALATPSRMPAVGDQEGMFVTARGKLVVACYNLQANVKFVYGGNEGAHLFASAGRPYTPRTYPGRVRYQEIHVFDKYGRPEVQDAAPGLAHVSGLAMDEEDNLYVLAGGARAIANGDKASSPFNEWSGTLIKLKPGNLRVEASAVSRTEGGQPKVPLPPESYPKRPHDLECPLYDRAWVEGADWFYGGVGYIGMNGHGAGPKRGGYAWDDWQSRFGFDRYARSFVHELDNYSIAVVDSNGNLVMRFGQYGNEQDGTPLVTAGGPEHTNSIGGSEVALCRPTTLTVDSDRRLFITDAANSRILSVKLDYHASERAALKEAAENR